MPELPEVETIVGDLAPQVEGRVFQEGTVYWAGALEEPGPDELVRELVGQRIESLSRRGKYILFELGSGQALIIHLGMTGRLYISQP
ncbi:MAG: DNA-formamidopyrimidine glycosylase family protein, partial [Dehalococcoidia bacterium]|nr:DNA-formamidopyrimidine glycosylase family protein [Dehalococcoidia bacterium]